MYMPMKAGSSMRSRRRVTRPRRRVVSGRGFYRGFGRDVGKVIGYGAGMVGRAYGAPEGTQNFLSNAGGYIGDKASQVTGWGSYKINQNNLLTNDPPMVANKKLYGGDLATVIRHREFIGDVKSGPLPAGATSTEFNLNYELPINPGLPATFPWASAVAGNYIQYSINGMLVEFVTTSGNAVSSTNSALGSVNLACQYDSILPSYANKQQMLAEEHAVSGVPSCNLILPIECAPNQTTITKLYVRSGGTPVGTDIRMYDLGRISCATSGCQAPDVTLGELWVTYDITLFKASLQNSVLDNGGYGAHWTIAFPSGVNQPTLGPNNLLANNIDGFNLGVPATAGNNKFVFTNLAPNKYWNLQILASGTVGGGGVPTLILTNMVLFDQLGNQTTSSAGQFSVTGVAYSVFLEIVDPNQNADFEVVGCPSSNGAAVFDFVVTPISDPF
nr:putative capsid protein [Crucivirus sp.]